MGSVLNADEDDVDNAQSKPKARPTIAIMPAGAKATTTISCTKNEDMINAKPILYSKNITTRGKEGKERVFRPAKAIKKGRVIHDDATHEPPVALRCFKTSR